MSESSLCALIADEIQQRGRKHASGEPLFFDRHNLELAIQAGIEAKALLLSTAPFQAEVERTEWTR